MFSKKIISLDIGSKNIKIVTGKYKKGKVHIDNDIVFPTPLHSINDGDIMDKSRLAEAIKNMLSMNNIKIKDTYCTTNSTEVINREIIVPKADEDELDTVVQFEVQQYLPIILDDYILQYRVLEEIEDESSENSLKRLRVFVIAYPKRIGEQYLKLIQDIGLNPLALDVNLNAVSKLFREDSNINEELHKSEETIAVIDMGKESININIFSNGEIEFTRNIASGGEILDRSICKKYDITLEEAEKRKKQYCDLMGENKTEVLVELNIIIKNTINEWIDEMSRIFQFYRNRRIGNKIDKIYLYGGGSRLKGLEEYMSSILNIPVSKISSMSNIVLGKDANKEDLDYYLNAIGAIIRL